QTHEAAEAAIFGQDAGHIKIDVPGLVRHSEGGSVYYTKVDADGVEHRYDAANPYAISDADAQIIGHNSPDWTMGINNTFTYKNFDLSIYMYLRWGSMFKYSLATDYDPTGVNNYPAHFNVWSPTNPSNDFPALDANISNKLADYTGFSSLAYVDGSFFKIKNITLGYTLPSKVCKKIGIQNLRVYGTITNPLVVAKSDILKDYDPELNGNMNYPLTKQLVFGVNFSF
ncbi:MAG: SusC/RagA family protein, partial [Alistipes sp.]|nr:SusC/RagA family protein [Alistipes sp.]